jgi:hypothetical protein
MVNIQKSLAIVQGFLGLFLIIAGICQLSMGAETFWGSIYTCAKGIDAIESAYRLWVAPPPPPTWFTIILRIIRIIRFCAHATYLSIALVHFAQGLPTQ